MNVIRKYSHYWVLVFILGVALVLRLCGIEWGLPGTTHPAYSYHPDETFMLIWARWLVLGRIIDKQFIYGGTLFYTVLNAFNFFGREFANLLGGLNTLADSILFGRYFMAGVALINILLVYECGRTLFNQRVGVLAAAFLAVAPAHVVLAQQVRPDEIGAFLVTLILYLSTKIPQAGPAAWIRPLAISGFVIGVTAGFRAPLVVFGAMPVVAYLCSLEEGSLTSSLRNIVTDLSVMGVLFLVGYAIASPHTLIYFKGFVDGMATTWRYESAPFPDSVGRGPLLLQHLWRMLPQALSGGIYVLAAAGLLFAIRRRTRSDIILLVGVALYTALMMFASWTVVRYSLPLVPLLDILAARLAVYGLEPARAMALRVSTAVVVLVAIGWSLLSVAAYVRLEAGTNVRDIAAQWIDGNIPASNSILMLRTYSEDYFFNPPVANVYHVKYLVLGENSGGDVTLQAPWPDYVVLNEYLFKDLDRLGERYPFRQQRLFYQQLKKDYVLVREFKLPIELFGIDFSEAFSSYDYAYVDPGIRVYRRR